MGRVDGTRIRCMPYAETYIHVCDFFTQVKKSDNESDRIPGCGPMFGSLVLESDGILVSEFGGALRWVLTDLYYQLVILTN
jgi:hypothetical protein